MHASKHACTSTHLLLERERSSICRFLDNATPHPSVVSSLLSDLSVALLASQWLRVRTWSPHMGKYLGGEPSNRVSERLRPFELWKAYS
jgi:hypothetical protein